MPQQTWNKKRERQYQHIKQGLKKSGRKEDLAEEIAARTVNKERARSGEARTKSRSSVKDISRAGAEVSGRTPVRVDGRRNSSTTRRDSVASRGVPR